MSIAEIKLQLIREIDRLPKERLMDLLKLLTGGKFSKKAQANRKIGALKGTLLYMSPDFDEPLDDFKEYME